jgi:hypothetical protein
MTTIQKYMMATFLRLRLGIGVIGIIFPFLLWGGGMIARIPLADSMSAYYHANSACLDPKRPDTCGAADPAKGTGPMRNCFVGVLFIIGTVMFLMKGFSHWEDWALNVAGITAICVALFPMPWSPGKDKGFPIHGLSAITFFVCIAFVCAFCSEKTLKYMPNIPDREKVIAGYKRSYRLFAVIMVLSPATAWVFNKISLQDSWHFWAEAFGILAFGSYWITKTFEFRRSDIERRVLTGEVEMNTSSLS